MKKKNQSGRRKTMKAIRKKTPYREAALAIEKKMAEIKKETASAAPIRNNPSLFRYMF